MKSPKFRVLLVGALTLAAGFMACTKKNADSANLELNLFNGVREVARLGDSEREILQHPKWEFSKTKMPTETGIDKLGFTDTIQFEEIGVQIFLRQGRAAMIKIAAPFHGSIQGKSLKVFSFPPPGNLSWSDYLLRELGSPPVKASGGNLGSETYFYSWGDISYNRMGPREIFLYRDQDIGASRQKSYGKDLQLMKN